jgi:hypothetical protein
MTDLLASCCAWNANNLAGYPTIRDSSKGPSGSSSAPTLSTAIYTFRHGGR